MLQSAHAVLLLQGHYVLQLRDNFPGISAPGQWSLFGGEIDQGETPGEALEREIQEELSIRPTDTRFLWQIEHFCDVVQSNVMMWIFEGSLNHVWHDHHLREGQDVGVFMFEELTTLQIPVHIYTTLERHRGLGTY